VTSVGGQQALTTAERLRYTEKILAAVEFAALRTLTAMIKTQHDGSQVGGFLPVRIPQR